MPDVKAMRSQQTASMTHAQAAASPSGDCGLAPARRVEESEAKYRQTFDAALDCVIAMDAQGRIVDFNPAASVTFGYEKEQAIGRPLADLIIPHRLREAHRNGLAHYLRSGEGPIFNKRLEMPALRADGSEFPAELSVVPLQPHGAKDPLFVGFIRDITDRKRAEEAVEVSGRRFRAMADSAPVLIWMSGPDKKRNWFNKPWLEFTGHNLEQDLGEGWLRNVHPQDRDKALTEYVSAFDRREPFHTEYRLLGGDGEYRWFLETGTPQHEQGEFVGYIGSCVDITTHKSAERGLGQLAAIVEYSDDAILSKSLDGVILSWNQGAQRLFGYSSEEVIGQSIYMVVPPERRDEEADILARLSRGERIEHYDTLRRAKDGRLIDVSITVSPILDEFGRAIGASTVARDVSARKRAEDSLREYAGRLAAILNTAVDGIITIDAHGTIESANRAAVGLFGYSAEEMIGRNVKMLMPEPFHSEHDGYVSSYLQTGVRKIIGIGREVVGRRKDGSTFPMELAVSETRLANRLLFTGLVRDITARNAAERAVRESEEHLRLAVASAPLTLCHCDLERRVTWFARGPQAGLLSEEVLGRRVEDVLGEQGMPLVELQQSALESGTGSRGEFTVDTPEGRKTWDVTVEPIEDDGGEVRGVTVIALDITERKVSEDRLQMLLGELSHRVKNTLASVQSIATQTVLNCPNPAEFCRTFESRLHSLAYTHSLLTRGQWRGADLRAIVMGELSPHATAESGKTRLIGPKLYLSPKAALSLHLVLHELATNAAKYGALSEVSGRVDISWDLVDTPNGAALRLTWTESGGPPVSPPKRRGFGSTVIEKSVEYELDGVARLEYDAAGVRFECEIPWSEAIGYVHTGS